MLCLLSALRALTVTLTLTPSGPVDDPIISDQCDQLTVSSISIQQLQELSPRQSSVASKAIENCAPAAEGAAVVV